MPFIEEKDLLNLHKDIEKAQTNNEKLLDQIKYKNKELHDLKVQRNALLAIAILLMLVILAILLFKSKFNSSSFVSDSITGSSTEHVENLKAGFEELTPQDEEFSQVEDYYLAKALLRKEKIYAVQVMAFNESKTALISEGLLHSRFLKSSSFYGYSLGNFETLDEAQAFRKQLVAMGFKDAFVASYQNGKRIRIEEPY